MKKLIITVDVKLVVVTAIVVAVGVGALVAWNYFPLRASVCGV